MDLQTLDQLQEYVFSRQTVLGKIFYEHAGESLAQYAGGWEVKTGQRHKALVPILRDIAAGLYGKDSAERIASQFSAQPLVSSVDHHGLLNHPFFVNSNLIFSLKQQELLLCLPTAGVSLNNNTSWSGCLLAHGRDGTVRRFSFFPDRVKTQTVLSTAAFTLKDAEQVRQKIVHDEALEPGGRNRLVGLVSDMFCSDPKLYEFSDFSSQAAYVSRSLWNMVFPEAPSVVYIPLEQLISEILLRLVIPDKTHVLHGLFFSAAGWNAVEKTYAGNLGAFSSAHKGSFLFWGVDKKSRRVHLVRSDSRLKDHEFVVGQSPEEIAPLLRSGRLYPTSLACFLVLLYYGVTCLGGFNQVNWLSAIRDKFSDLLLSSSGQEQLAAEVAGLATDNFAEGNLAYMQLNGQWVRPTGMDLWMDGSPWFPRYTALAESITVGESIRAQLPEIYKVITPAENRKPHFSALTDSMAANLSGLSGKLMFDKTR